MHGRQLLGEMRTAQGLFSRWEKVLEPKLERALETYEEATDDEAKGVLGGASVASATEHLREVLQEGEALRLPLASFWQQQLFDEARTILHGTPEAKLTRTRSSKLNKKLLSSREFSREFHKAQTRGALLPSAPTQPQAEAGDNVTPTLPPLALASLATAAELSGQAVAGDAPKVKPHASFTMEESSEQRASILDGVELVLPEQLPSLPPPPPRGSSEQSSLSDEAPTGRASTSSGEKTPGGPGRSRNSSGGQDLRSRSSSVYQSVADSFAESSLLQSAQSVAKGVGRRLSLRSRRPPPPPLSERENSQLQFCTRWWSARLAQKGVAVGDLRQACRAAVVPLQLAQELTGSTPHAFHVQPASRSERVANLSAFLAMIHSAGVVIVSSTAGVGFGRVALDEAKEKKRLVSDLADGDHHAIIKLTWSLVLRFEVCADGEQPADAMASLLDWSRATASGYEGAARAPFQPCSLSPRADHHVC